VVPDLSGDWSVMSAQGSRLLVAGTGSRVRLGDVVGCGSEVVAAAIEAFVWRDELASTGVAGRVTASGRALSGAVETLVAADRELAGAS
jgi:hypothetical protein